MPKRIFLELCQKDKMEWEAAYHKNADSAFKLRVLMILLLAEGKKLKEIGNLLHISDEIVRRWFHRYLLEGVA